MSALRKTQGAPWVLDFTALFEGGRYAEAGALYDEHAAGPEAPITAALLRARVSLRSDLPAALRLLNDLRTSRGTPEFVAHAMILGEAYAQTGDLDGADEHLAAALAAARNLGDPDLIAGVGYRIGRRHIVGDDPASARNALAIARLGRSPAARLDAAHLDAYVLSREGRHREQAFGLIELLRSIDPNSREHMEHRACATHSLAVLARELYVPDAVPEIERQLGGSPWPDDLRVQRFQAMKALGWSKALQGDYLNAFRYLKQSATLAPDSAWRAMAFCDRSYLARAVGEPRWSRQELLDAEEAADATHWQDVGDEESVALLLLAELFALIDPAKASAYLATFRSLGDIRNARALMRKDERRTALADYACAVVDLALGSPRLAVTRLRKALAVYDPLNYDWRAGRCLLRLFDATGDRSYLVTAEEKLRNHSSSWLGAELRERSTKGSPGVELSPTQTQVFRQLCKGLSNAEIAEDLGRSEHTVANHAKAVLKAFGVSSRSALIAEAMKRNVL